MTSFFAPDSVVIIDGGLATEIERRGYDVSSSLWSARVLIDHPDVIEGIHSDFLAAGADCIISASYQVSFEGFAEAGLKPADTVSALERSVTLAKKARDRFQAVFAGPRLVAASVGPYGAILHNGAEYIGNYGLTSAELTAFHARRLKVLAGSQPDLFACETVPSLQEALSIAAALKNYPSIPAWISFTCQDESTNVHGEDMRDCARLLDEVPQLVAIGVNCTPPQLVEPIVQRIRGASSKRIVVYPNVGQSWDAVARVWRNGNGNCDEWGAFARKWRRAGATCIGGCCGTTPADIREMREALASM